MKSQNLLDIEKAIISAPANIDQHDLHQLIEAWLAQDTDGQLLPSWLMSACPWSLWMAMLLAQHPPHYDGAWWQSATIHLHQEVQSNVARSVLDPSAVKQRWQEAIISLSMLLNNPSWSDDSAQTHMLTLLEILVHDALTPNHRHRIAILTPELVASLPSSSWWKLWGNLLEGTPPLLRPALADACSDEFIAQTLLEPTTYPLRAHRFWLQPDLHPRLQQRVYPLCIKMMVDAWETNPAKRMREEDARLLSLLWPDLDDAHQEDVTAWWGCHTPNHPPPPTLVARLERQQLTTLLSSHLATDQTVPPRKM